MNRHIARIAILAAFVVPPVESKGDFLYTVDSNGNSGMVVRFDTATKAETPIAEQGGLGVAIDGSGNVFVSNPSDNTIEKIPPGGTASTFVSTGQNTPSSLAVDSAGNLYAYFYQDGTITKITPEGASSTFVTTGPVGSPNLNSNAALAFDSSNNLYLADISNNRILKFTPDGMSSIFTSGLSQPRGLAIDASNDVYTTSQNDLVKITPQGVVSPITQGRPLRTPFSLVLDPSGNLYAAEGELQERIVIVSPDGSVSTFVSGFFPSDLAYQVIPVPEPASLTLLGIGTLGLLARLRRGRVRRLRLPSEYLGRRSAGRDALDDVAG